MSLLRPDVQAGAPSEDGLLSRWGRLRRGPQADPFRDATGGYTAQFLTTIERERLLSGIGIPPSLITIINHMAAGSSLVGPMGMPGLDGEEGPMGPVGPQGARGAQGLIGPPGLDGDEGPEGPAGPIGPQGIQGIQGPMGPMGVPGLDGLDGDEGPVGPAGPRGATGAMGPPGLDGLDAEDRGLDLAMVGGQQLYFMPWTSWSLTPFANAGTVTTFGTVTGEFMVIEKNLFWRAIIEITTNGTGATSIDFNLPLDPSAQNLSLGYGRCAITTGKQLQVANPTALSTGRIFTYDNLYPAADGAKLLVAGFYKIP